VFYSLLDSVSDSLNSSANDNQTSIVELIRLLYNVDTLNPGESVIVAALDTNEVS